MLTVIKAVPGFPHYVISGSLSTSFLAGGMTGGSVVMCCGVRDDGTSALSCGAGPFGGYAARFDDLFTRVAQRWGFRE
jgi:hypothetical protein